jgi:hypothetical protein
MPRYFFDVKNGHRLIDASGLDCKDDNEAAIKADIIAKQIAKDAPPSAPSRHIAVLDSDRKQISAVLINSDNKHDGK